MRRYFSVGLPLSVALHAAVVTIALTLIPRNDPGAPLFIDLTISDLTVARSTEAPAVRPTAPGPRRATGRGGSSSPGSRATVAPPAAGALESSLSWTARTSSAPAPSPAKVDEGSERRGLDAPADRVAAVPPMTAPPAPVAGDEAATAPSTTGASAVTAAPAGVPATTGAGDSARSAPSGGAIASGGSGGIAGAAPAPGAAPGGAGGTGAVIASRGAGGGAEGPGAGYGPYLAGVRRLIAESLRYPPSARRRHMTGTVQIEIVIRADGTIAAAEVVASSSHAILDETAVETARSLPPQPFPPNLAPRTLRVRLPVVFTLE